MQLKASTRLLLLASSVVCVTAISGCGDDGEDTATSNTATSNTATSNTSTSNTTVDGAEAYLGDQCGTTESCNPTTQNWPECAASPCGEGEGRCWAMGHSVGYCTHSCTTDNDCQGADMGLWGSDFTCVTANNGGFCMPGSNNNCSVDSDCTVGGEVCKAGVIDGPSGLLEVGLVCQPATEGGAPIGGACNIDPTDGALTLCANDLCYSKLCSAPCTSERDLRCGDGMSCSSDVLFQDFYTTTAEITGQFCSGAGCNSANDCAGEDFNCIPLIDGTGAAAIISGTCFPSVDDFGVLEVADLGEACNDDPMDTIDDLFCSGRFCLDGRCSASCEADNDCASNQICASVLGELDAGQTVAWNVCTFAEGSKTSCLRDSDCGGGEICNQYYIGTMNGDGSLTNARTASRCVLPVAGGVQTGSSCDAIAPCEHEGMCFTAGSSPTPFCSEPCTVLADCPGGMTCAVGAIWDNNSPNDATDDLEISICVPNL